MQIMSAEGGKVYMDRENGTKLKVYLKEVSDGDEFAKYNTWKYIYKASVFGTETYISPHSSPTAASNPQALDVILDGLSNKLILIILDMACHLVEEVEQGLDAGADGAEQASTDHRMVNAFKGYLLTLRFDEPDNQLKVNFLRETAIDRLTAILEQQVQRSSLMLRQATMRDAVKELETRDGIQKAWDEWTKVLMKDVVGSATSVESKESDDDADDTDASTQDGGAANKENTSYQGSGPIDSDKLAILAIAGLSPPPENTTSFTDSRDCGNLILGLLKGPFQQKLEYFHLHMSKTLDSILCDFALAKLMPDVSLGKKPLTAKEDLTRILEKYRDELEATVRSEVKEMVRAVGGMAGMRLQEDMPVVRRGIIGNTASSALAAMSPSNSKKFFF